MVIVENEEQRLIFGQVGYEVVDPLFELCPRNLLARPKVVMLSGSVSVRGTEPNLAYYTYLAEIGNVSVEILRVLFDDQMTFVFNLLAVAPLDGAVSELQEDGVIAIPGFEIDS